MLRPGCTIGLDIGTTSVKAVALDASGHVVARNGHRLATVRIESGMAEQDPYEVYRVVTEVMVEVAKEVHALGLDIERVGFSAAMHSVMAIGEDGTPLMRALTWMDVRAKSDAASLWNTELGKEIYHRTGTPIHAMSPLVKLIWLKRTAPNTFLKVRRFASLKEWIWYHWFGTWTIDESMASATGLFHLERRTWDESALSVAGISSAYLSNLVPTSYTTCGVLDNALIEAGYGPTVTFNIGASDGVLANLGVGITDSQSMVLTIGTSLAVRTGSTQIVTDASFRPFCYVFDDTRFIVGGPSNSGGVVLDWLYRQVLSDVSGDADARFAALCLEAGTSDIGGLVCLPFVAGERAPLWDEAATGAFVGLQIQHGKAHLLRAALEGILYNAYEIASKLFHKLGKPKSLVVSGRIFDFPWVRQLVADVFDLPIRFEQDGDASVRGAILLANRTCNAGWQSETNLADTVSAQMTVPRAARYYREKQVRYARLCEVILEAVRLDEPSMLHNPTGA